MIDELTGVLFVRDDLNRSDPLPWTQVAVALAFLKERSSRNQTASSDWCADAKTEFHALREKHAADG